MKQRKAFKYRFYPTDAQIAQLAHSFGCARYVFNWGLQQRTEAWQQEQKSLRYHQTALMLTQLKKSPNAAFLNNVSNVVLQQSLRNLDRAFGAFFSQQGRYPSFKSKNGRQSIRYATNGFAYRDGAIILAKQSESLNIVWSRPLPEDSRLVSLTVSRDATLRYFISILVETDIQPLIMTNAAIGIDVGLKVLATCSNGETLTNPKHFKTKERALRVRKRRLFRKVKGSNNRKKARIAVAKIYAKISDSRKDHLHKFTTKTINENQVIVVEGLAIANMMKNHCLASAIGDAGWASMFRQLEYKANWYGRTYIELDRFFPGSKMCSSCGYLLSHLNLSTREWDCPKCSTHHDRDENAAKNHLAAGLYLLKTTRSDAAKVTPTKYE